MNTYNNLAFSGVVYFALSESVAHSWSALVPHAKEKEGRKRCLNFQGFVVKCFDFDLAGNRRCLPAAFVVGRRRRQTGLLTESCRQPEFGYWTASVALRRSTEADVPAGPTLAVTCLAFPDRRRRGDNYSNVALHF